ncbi:unnamed protein product [Arctogadus glacialis]
MDPRGSYAAWLVCSGSEGRPKPPLGAGGMRAFSVISVPHETQKRRPALKLAAAMDASRLACCNSSVVRQTRLPHKNTDGSI